MCVESSRWLKVPPSSLCLVKQSSYRTYILKRQRNCAFELYGEDTKIRKMLVNKKVLFRLTATKRKGMQDCTVYTSWLAKNQKQVSNKCQKLKVKQVWQIMSICKSTDNCCFFLPLKKKLSILPSIKLNLCHSSRAAHHRFTVADRKLALLCFKLLVLSGHSV
jgi:hypothetical protein